MDWETWLMNWGPAAPLLLIFVKSHYDLVHKIIPQGLKAITTSTAKHERSARRRHAEHIALQKKILDAIANQGKVCEAKKTRPATKRRRRAR